MRGLDAIDPKPPRGRRGASRRLARHGGALATLAAGLMLASPATVFADVGAAHGLGRRDLQGQWEENWGQIRDVAVGGTGVLWMATDRALVRFDGERFRRYTADDHEAFGAAQPTALLAGRDGGLWVGLSSGRLLRTSVAERFRFTDVLPARGAPISALAEDGHGGLWMGTPRGLRRVGPAGAPLPAPAFAHPVLRLVVDHEDRLWLGSRHGLWTYDGQTLRSVRSEPVLSLAVGSDGAVWVGLQRALLKVLPGGGEDPPLAFVRGYVSQALAAEGDAVWVGRHMAGLHRLGHDELVLGAKSGLPDLGISALTADGLGGVWGATSSGTLFVVRPQEVANLGDPEGLGRGPSFAVAETAAGDLWYTNLGGVHRLRGKQIDHFDRESQASPSQCPRGLAAADGTVYLATCDQGVLAWDGHRFTPLPGSPPKMYNVWARQGGGVFASDPEGAVYALEEGRFAPALEGWTPCGQRVRARACSRQVISLLERKDGTVLMGTRGEGVLVVRAGKVERQLAAAEGMPSAPAQALLEDPHGAVWIATAGAGLARLLHQSVTPVSREATGLPAELYGLIEDRRGRFWMSSDQGVFRVARSDLEDLLAHKRSRVLPRHFGQREGMSSIRGARDFSHALLLTQDGEVVVPTVGGLSLFDARHRPPDTNLPRPILEQVWVDGTRVGLDDPGSISVRRGHGNVSFSIVVPGLGFPGGFKVAARFAGLTDWQQPGHDGVFQFPGVPTGRHALEVRVDRVSTGETTTDNLLSLRLLAMHQLGWFRGLMAGALALALMLGLWLRQRQASSRSRAILEERRRLAQDLHDALAVSFTGIGYQLDTLDQVLGADAPAPVRKLLSDARAMVGHSRQEARRSVWDIRSQALEQRSFAAALRAIADEASKVGKARVVIDVNDLTVEPPEAVSASLVRIAQEAIVNAMVHGKAENVFLTVRSQPQLVRLEVADDGQGLDEDQVEAGMHFGLLGMRERAETQGGQFAIENRPEGGAHLSVTLPLRGRSARWRKWFFPWAHSRRAP